MKRLAVLIAFLLCLACLISTYSFSLFTLAPEEVISQTKTPDVPGTPDMHDTPEISGTTPKNNQPDPTADVKPTHTPEPSPVDTAKSPAMVYEQGVYAVGTDIPAGVYMAVNNGTDVSRVTVKDTLSPSIEKPQIAVTARYMSVQGTFADRSTYVEAVRRGGGMPIQPSDDLELAKILSEGSTDYAEALAQRYDGLLLTGGGDIAGHFFGQEHHSAANPPDEILDAAEIALCKAFIQANKPVLGICRGMQVLNVAMGGELIQDIPALLDIPHGFHNTHNGVQARHEIRIREGTWLHKIAGPQANVNSFHHQCVDGVADGFTVVAHAGPVIEAMERGNALGVQFHPERMVDEGMLLLFEDFIERCSYGNAVFNTFRTFIIFEVKESQFIEVAGAQIENIEQTHKKINESFEANSHYSEGMYLVGYHLQEGKYRLLADDADFSAYAIYENTTQESVLLSGAIPAEGMMITLTEGQLIKLICAKMAPTA